MEEKISNMERVKKARSFSGGISDDGSESNDPIYVFILNEAIKKDLFKFVSEKLKRDCYLIESGCKLAVRIKV